MHEPGSFGAPDEAVAHPGLLFDFMELRHATAVDVARFVNEWGALGLCSRHGLPLAHTLRKTRFGLTQESPAWTCSPRLVDERGIEWRVESVADWRRLAVEVDASIHLAKRLRTGKIGAPGALALRPRLPSRTAT